MGNQRENLRLHRGAGTGVDATNTEGRLACSRIPGSIAKGKEIRADLLCRAELIPEGVTILAGKPKVGKSWLALDLALALAGGRFVLGDIHLIEGDVLYAALEDNERRLRSRIERILTQDAHSGRLGLPSPRNGGGSMPAAWLMRRSGPQASSDPG